MSKVKDIIRKVDDLGRIVLPIEQRNLLGIQEGTALIISTMNDKITLQIAEHYCSLCGNMGEFAVFLNKNLCVDCIEAIKKM